MAIQQQRRIREVRVHMTCGFVDIFCIARIFEGNRMPQASVAASQFIYQDALALIQLKFPPKIKTLLFSEAFSLLGLLHKLQFSRPEDQDE
ncbi:hypothetical protein NPIL_144741 [Nephila pilipes]|uniref:Uncharacterized protein n=1 Tax=Nephila pilipes TaxID=299642 RepID=A0A8X6PSZ6_NEPPI|nr:hypothetical protein NPIL_144741 [Nephila pilipes]